MIIIIFILVIYIIIIIITILIAIVAITVIIVTVIVINEIRLSRHRHGSKQIWSQTKVVDMFLRTKQPKPELRCTLYLYYKIVLKTLKELWF